MKKVLIATDETKGSLAVLDVFRNQVRPPEEVILVHVQRPLGRSFIGDMVNEAEKYRDKENAAAIIIQKDWRMFKVKWKFDDKKRAT